jgi:hypothetical protein
MPLIFKILLKSFFPLFPRAYFNKLIVKLKAHFQWYDQPLWNFNWFWSSLKAFCDEIFCMIIELFLRHAWSYTNFTYIINFYELRLSTNDIASWMATFSTLCYFHTNDYNNATKSSTLSKKTWYHLWTHLNS